MSAHRGHVYQRLDFDPGRRIPIAVAVGALTALLALLGAVTVGSPFVVVIAVSASSLVILAGYLALPAIIRRVRELRAG